MYNAMYEISETIKLATELLTRKEELKQELPYHINVIDELHINENGHSRILTKLLKYKNPAGHFPLLESLLLYIIEKYPEKSFDKINISDPIITQEQERIDLWIRDKKANPHYAIVFENKVYNAQDQDAQLDRYIEKTLAHGFDQQQIYIIYLPQYSHEPAEQSWGKYKHSFVNRYANLSFRNDILMWLKSLESFPEKDYLLQSALQQYIDYLEGMFEQRNGLKEINKKMNTELLNKLQLSDKSEVDKLNIINDYRSRVENLSKSLQSLYEELGKGLVDEFCNIGRNYWSRFWGDDIYMNGAFQIRRKEIWNDYGLHLEWRDWNVEKLIGKNQSLQLEIHIEKNACDFKNTLCNSIALTDNWIVYSDTRTVDCLFGENHTPEEIRTIIESMYDKAKEVCDRIDELLSNRIAVKIYKTYKGHLSVPFSTRVWFWKPDFVVLGDTLKIDIDCQEHDKVHIMYFHGNIENFQSPKRDEFFGRLGAEYSGSRYHKDFDASKEQEIFDYINKILAEKDLEK